MCCKKVGQLLVVMLLGLVLTGCGGSGDVRTIDDVVLDLRLNSLTLEDADGNSLGLDFDPLRTSYTVFIPAEMMAVNLSVTASEEVTSLAYQLFPEASQREDGETFLGQNFSQNQVVELSPRAGENTLQIAVATDDGAGSLYSVLIIQENSNADLLAIGVSLLDITNPNNPVITTRTTELNFDKDTLEYTLDVPAGNCRALLFSQRAVSDSQVQLNRNRINLSESLDTQLSFPLVGASNLFSFEVVASDGTQKTYQLTINRTLGDEAVQLSSIKVANGALVEPVACNDSEYDILVSEDSEEVVVDVVLDNLEQTAISQTFDVTTLIAGTPITETLDVSLDPANADITQQYSFNLVRADSRLIQVSNALELQTAFDNAMPGDDILLLPGAYQTDIGFNAMVSGEEDNPITIQPAYLSTTPLVLESLTADTPVITVSGSYNNFNAMTISGVGSGILINGADQNQLTNINFDRLENGALMLLDADSNRVAINTFANISGAAIQVTQGSDSNIIERNVLRNINNSAAQSGNGLIIGTNDPIASMNNMVIDNLFASSINSSALIVNADAVDTKVIYNTIAASAELNVKSMLDSAGNGTSIEYNVFSLAPTNSTLENIIRLFSSSTDLTNTTIIQNSVNNPRQGNFINADENAVFSTSGNITAAAELVVNGGEQVDIETPTFALQLSVNDELCLSLNAPQNDRISVNSTAFMDQCNQGARQQWKQIITMDGYVLIQNQEDTSLYLTSDQIVNNSILAGVATIDSLTLGQQWRLSRIDENYQLFSRLKLNNLNASLCVLNIPANENTPVQGQTVSSCISPEAASNEFTLVF